MAELEEVPGPPGWPIMGNLGIIDRNRPTEGFSKLADEYGEFYRMLLPGRKVHIASSVRILEEISDENKFWKNPQGATAEVRNAVNDGLFTARPHEPNWGIAHRVLMPAFGPLAMRNMFDEMHDVACQLTMKWARHGPTEVISVVDDFTRLALDALSLCSMGYRFNSYYRTELHPFLAAMSDFLTECGKRAGRPLPAYFYKSVDEQYFKNVEIMRTTAREVIEARKSGIGADRKDLLQAMLDNTDPKTGQRMTDDSILDNLVTFLAAGHETTSGTLGFAFYQLLKHPNEYRKVQQEIDEVIGDGPVKATHMNKLPYITAVIRETLRLNSPVPQYAVQAREDAIIQGKWLVKKGEFIIALLAKTHMDPSVYGDDAEIFRPTRMLDENYNKLPAGALKAFGNGSRACIGRGFAIQEATLTMAMMLQNFDFEFEDPSYELEIKQTLTIKPDGLKMRAIPRHGMSPPDIEARLHGKDEAAAHNRSNSTDSGLGLSGETRPMTILYGSNSGTCESLANQLATNAVRHGFNAEVVDALDTGKENLPRDRPVVIITPSYEGQPADNAARFVPWLESIKDAQMLDGVNYAVFGVGHHDWVSTFHRIPKLVDEKLAGAGAKRVAALGLADAAQGDIFSDFETWEDETLWPSFASEYKVADSSEAETSLSNAAAASALDISITSLRASALRQDVQDAVVTKAQTLTAPGEPVKKHIEVRLPEGASYRTGDYIAILPFNPKENVRRVMRRFGLAPDATITIKGDSKASLPTNMPVSVQEVLSSYVELAQPATKRNLLTLAEAAGKDSAETQEALKSYANLDELPQASSRMSVLDLLEKYTEIDLSFGAFLSMMPSMRVRQYSISSSPVVDDKHCTITFSVLDVPSSTGNGGKHLGVATNYLQSLECGDKLNVSIRPSHAAFHPPADPEKTPVIMVSAGTGLAPFRGFIQERAHQITSEGRKLAPALLFQGCRDPDRDDLYAAEFAEWERIGAVSRRMAYSRAPASAGGRGKYVQDALAACKDELMALWKQDAKLFICGSRAVGNGVRDLAVKEKMARADAKGETPMSEEDASKWWESMRNERYATDVFD